MNDPYKHAIKLLTKKDYSVHKLKNKLFEKEFLEEEIEEAITLLLEKKYLREDYYAQARIRAFIKKGYSTKYIQEKLRDEKVDVDHSFIQDEYEYLQVTEEDQIDILIRKKMQQSSTNPEKIKRFLISKGHDYQLINDLLSQNLS